MVTPKKTPSGRWRARVYLGKKDGKPVYGSVTADTKRQCIDQAALLKAQGLPGEVKQTATLGELIDRYIATSETLSPTTLAGYRKIRRTMFQGIMDTPASELSDECLQKAINAEMRRVSRRGHNISAKTIQNAYGLVRAVLGAYTDRRTPRVKLPKNDPHFLNLPEPEFVLAAVCGTDIELPCLLAIWCSFTMSEVRGLKYSSIRNGNIYVDQVVVDVDGKPVEKKRAKNDERNRVAELTPEILDLLLQTTNYQAYLDGKCFDEYIWPYSHDKIRHRLDQLCPGITFHRLRHMYASIMLMLGIPDKYIMEGGGWRTTHVMKRTYQETFSKERRLANEKMNAYMTEKLRAARALKEKTAQKYDSSI